jgi:2-oxoglutarate ferredoxin oxidoreductase subunit delta
MRFPDSQELGSHNSSRTRSVFVTSYLTIHDLLNYTLQENQATVMVGFGDDWYLTMAHGTIVIDEERCKGCELCTTVCPQQVITMNWEVLNGKGYHPALLSDTESRCTGCAICAVICPDTCITVYREVMPHRTRMISS